MANIFISNQKLVFLSFLVGLLITFLFLITYSIKNINEEAQLLKLFKTYYQLPEVKDLKKDLMSYYYSEYPAFVDAPKYKEYYISPIKILSIKDNQFGGEIIRIFFINKFDAIFDIWVYEIDVNKFSVRSINKVEYSLEEFKKIKNNLKFYLRNNNLKI
ncbi:MAG: hypothetical protein WC860_07405 [Candidatus Margulisiibacteriota bacterium]|jgi:hypothetical protein